MPQMLLVYLGVFGCMWRRHLARRTSCLMVSTSLRYLIKETIILKSIVSWPKMNIGQILTYSSGPFTSPRERGLEKDNLIVNKNLTRYRDIFEGVWNIEGVLQQLKNTTWECIGKRLTTDLVLRGTTPDFHSLSGSAREADEEEYIVSMMHRVLVMCLTVTLMGETEI